MYSPQDLVALVAIAETGSLRAAASRVGRTQPAVTQAIRRLELILGFELLDRSGYRARLTERGELFVKHARMVVQESRELEHFAALLSQGVEPRLRVVCHGAIAIEAWLPLTQDLAQRFPNTVVELETVEGDAAVRRLLDDQAQLSLLLHSIPDRYRTRVESRKVGDVDFVNVVRTDQLARLRGKCAMPQILVADFEDPATAYGVAPGKRFWRVSSHRIKAALIRRGDGWGSVPQDLVADDLRQGTLTALSHRGLAARSQHAFALYRKRADVHGPVASFVWNAAVARLETIRA